jgi:hypothetical protein
MAKKRTPKLVTKESFIALLNNEDPNFVKAVIGRALVVLFNNQTEDERKTNDTNHENGEGFTGADSRSGCISAKYFIKHGTLEDWMVEQWTKQRAHGPRIAKYWRQLNDAAIRKAEEKARLEAIGK